MPIYKYLPLLLIWLMVSLACVLTDAKDVAQTLNRSLDLLQEIQESGTWRYIGDGITAIDEAGGYQGSISITAGTTTPTGETLTEVTDTVRWQITTDADGDSRIISIVDDTRHEFLVIQTEQVDANGNRQSDIYKVTPQGLECQTNQTSDELFAVDLNQAFANYSAIALGVQVISVAEADGEETINGFASSRYKLVSKLEEAIAILKEFPSEDLQQDLAGVPPFYIEGAIYLDQKTQAMTRFEAQYADLEKQEGVEFTFDLLALGNQADIQLDESQIITPCPTSRLGQ